MSTDHVVGFTAGWIAATLFAVYVMARLERKGKR